MKADENIPMSKVAFGILIITGMSIGGLLSTVLTAYLELRKPPPEITTDNLLQCLPRDLGEKSYLYLEQAEVLTLHCDRMEIVSGVEGRRSPVIRFKVPVSVE